MVRVHQSSQALWKFLRLNSMASRRSRDNSRNKYWFVTQLVEYRSFTPGVESSSLSGPTRIGYRLIGKAPGWRYEFESHWPIRIGWVAQWQSGGLLSRWLQVRILLHPQLWVRRRWRVVADCKSVAFGLNKFESYHSHKKLLNKEQKHERSVATKFNRS